MKLYLRGLRAGIPIGLGYLSVSFTFGIMAISLGFSWWQAVIIGAVLAFLNRGLTLVAVCASSAALICELILMLIK